MSRLCNGLVGMATVRINLTGYGGGSDWSWLGGGGSDWSWLSGGGSDWSWLGGGGSDWL